MRRLLGIAFAAAALALTLPTAVTFDRRGERRRRLLGYLLAGLGMLALFPLLAYQLDPVMGIFIGAIVFPACLFFGVLGVFIGPFCGALLGELLHGRRLDPAAMGQATKVGFGTWLGIVFGVALKLTLALAMLALFAWAWWK